MLLLLAVLVFSIGRTFHYDVMHYIDAGRLFSLLPIRLHNTLKVALTHEQQHGFISTHATLIFRRRRRRRFSLRFFFFFRFVVVVASAAAAGAV